MDKLTPLLILCLLACFVSCQYDQGRGGFQQGNQPPANILLHKQALGQDGSFNYAFAADNGLQQGEVINPDGSRKGSYSYVDPDGKTVTLSYTAGKDGFKVLSGDHIPRTPELQQHRQNSQYYQQPPRHHHHYQPSPQESPQYPVFRPNPIPLEAYKNAPNAPAYRGNFSPNEEAFRQAPHHHPSSHQRESLPYEGPYRLPPQLPQQARPAPQYQPRQYSVQEGSHERPSPYLNQQFRAEYRQEDPRKPHSFGNGGASLHQLTCFGALDGGTFLGATLPTRTANDPEVLCSFFRPTLNSEAPNL